MGATIALPISTVPAIQRTVRQAGLLLWSGLLAAAPDLDTLFFGVIPYAHFFGHRGFFHSLFFAGLLALALSALIAGVARHFDHRSFFGITAAFALALVSHGLLDAMTDAGLGVMLFFPFSQERIFLPWRPFHAPPINVAKLSMHQLQLIAHSEWPILLGCTVFTIVIKFHRRWIRNKIVNCEL